LNGKRIVASTKASTTVDVTTGIVQAIREVLRKAAMSPDDVKSVMIGTTHFTNAFVEGKRLLEVGIIRIAAPATLSLLPLIGWPKDLANAIGRHVYVVPGGYDYDGREIAAFDEAAVREAVLDIRRKGLRAVAITSVFSSVNADMETAAAAIVRELMPEAHVTLSHEIGRVGLLERENAAIMNAALSDLSSQVIKSFRKALSDLGVHAVFFISQNDGTLMAADVVERFPVLTIASGPTNSMRGAAFLTEKTDAIIVDIGGTTADVGALTNGFPRESSVAVNIGGVRTNFRMPDILAIGVGGGSIIREVGPDNRRTSIGGKVTIGPDSVGYELTEKALVFGGTSLTLTDIAVAAGVISIGEPAKVAHLDKAFVANALEEMHCRLDEAIDRMKTSFESVPVILVGGGSALVKRPLVGASEMVVPENAGVANAIGAAIAQVSGELDRVYNFDTCPRDAALSDARDIAFSRAREAGAGDNIRVLDVEEVPLAYLPGGAVRIRVKVVGDLPVELGA
jgi:N-methylhydantoinase A/oxoprolinase/acetone carboxylase beta subunit